MHFEFKKGDRVSTLCGRGTVCGIIACADSFPVHQIVLVMLDNDEIGKPFYLSQEAVDPTVSARIIHELRVQER